MAKRGRVKGSKNLASPYKVGEKDFLLEQAPKLRFWLQSKRAYEKQRQTNVLRLQKVFEFAFKHGNKFTISQIVALYGEKYTNSQVGATVSSMLRTGWLGYAQHKPTYIYHDKTYRINPHVVDDLKVFFAESKKEDA